MSGPQTLLPIDLRFAAGAASRGETPTADPTSEDTTIRPKSRRSMRFPPPKNVEHSLRECFFGTHGASALHWLGRISAARFERRRNPRFVPQRLAKPRQDFPGRATGNKLKFYFLGLAAGAFDFGFGASVFLASGLVLSASFRGLLFFRLRFLGLRGGLFRF